MKNYVFLALFGFAVIAVVPAAASTATFSFTAADNTGNSNGDALNFSPFSGAIAGLTNVQVTAFSTAAITGDTGSTVVSKAAVDEYSGDGLGVCGTNEGTGCSNPLHQVDNTDNGYEFVLFKFSTPVDLSSVTLLDYQGVDMDMSYWTSTVAPTFTTLGVLTNTADFTGGQTNDLCNTNCSSGDTITDSLTTNGGTSTTGVSYLLIGAYNASGDNDTFKIQQLIVSGTQTTQSSTPEPATFGMLGLALASLGLIARKRKLS